MSDQKIDDSSSFYPSGIDNSESSLTAEDIFLKEIYHLTSPGPFMDDEGRIALRGFSYKDLTLFGFLVEETSDAFLVMYPASLARDDEGVKATQAIASPLAKIMKTSVGIMSLPTPVQTLYYLSLVLPKLAGSPGYFTQARVRQVTSIIELLKIALGVNKVENKTDLQNVRPGGSKLPAEDTFRVPDHLIPRIAH